ncbi:hypothetical protein [Kiloniella sp.]|uniref:hypothetical protein n=1 Tax=Kiloniella sp. TaxID=1938587 RepID=UPI003A8F0FB6
MIDIIGWWAFDPENEALVNKTTGERVRFVDRMAGEFVPAEGEWLRFDYEHDGLGCPVLVEVGEIEYYKDFNRNTDTERGLGWQLDYIHSAQLWNQEQLSNNPSQSYGLWRRIDDCVCDALRFWPQNTGAGQLPNRFILTGGWFNSSWSAHLERTYFPIRDHFYESYDGFDDTNPQKQWLFPLDEKSPPKWIFHNDVGKKPEEGEYDETLYSSFWLNSLFPGNKTKVPIRDKAGDIVSGDHTYIHLSDTQITGIHGQTIYMESADRSSVLALKRGPTRVDTDRVPRHFTFFYADKDITAPVHTARPQVVPIPKWTISNIKFHQTRHPEWPNEYWSEPKIPGIAGNNPALEMWRRTDPKIRDAFLCWEGTDLRHEEWVDGFALPKVMWVSMKGHFIAGIWYEYAYYYSRYIEQPKSLTQALNTVIFI